MEVVRHSREYLTRRHASTPHTTAPLLPATTLSKEGEILPEVENAITPPAGRFAKDSGTNHRIHQRQRRRLRQPQQLLDSLHTDHWMQEQLVQQREAVPSASSQAGRQVVAQFLAKSHDPPGCLSRFV